MLIAAAITRTGSRQFSSSAAMTINNLASAIDHPMLQTTCAMIAIPFLFTLNSGGVLILAVGVDRVLAPGVAVAARVILR